MTNIQKIYELVAMRKDWNQKCVDLIAADASDTQISAAHMIVRDLGAELDALRV